MMGKTLIVNSTRDVGDQSPGDGLCFTGVFIQVGARFVRECTLRAAIEEANATTAADTINFNIAGAGPHTISPTSELPAITHPVTINGYSQPGSSPNTAAAGTNAVLKIVLDGSNIFEFVSHGLVVLASNSTVKGLVINGWPLGVILGRARQPGDHTGNILEGCFIGTDATGTTASGNGLGVGVGGTNTIIGGTTPAARNLISGNGNRGPAISLGGSLDGTGNIKVEGNLIGTSKDGIAPLRNSNFGILVHSSGNTIGGSGAARNTIAFNERDGVVVFDHSGNRILSNSIYDNGGLGIDLENDGVTVNDLFDRDTGANTLQNFPVISSATTFGALTTIQGSLHSTPKSTFTIQFFSSPAPDPSGFGEGKTFLGQTSVTTNSNGNRSFTFVPAQKVPVGSVVTATATGVGGTSEFSRARLVVEPPVIGT